MSDWENGLCEMDCGNCMAACCCTCFAFGRASSRLSRYPDPNPKNLSNCNGACMNFFTLLGLQMSFIPIMKLRTRMREKFGIEGNGCSDCMVASFCGCCAVAQMNQEAKKRAEKHQSAGVNKGYVAAPAMQYAPQDGQPMKPQPTHA